MSGKAAVNTFAAARAVFFDKDGVINADKGIRGNFEPVALTPGVCNLIAELKSSGFMIFVATNQPVVARGLMSEEELAAYMEKFAALVAAEASGAIIDRIYCCPHHPSANDERYRVSCGCRKPKPGMLLRAAAEFGVDLAASYMIGDRMSDVIAGALAGCKTVHFLSGAHAEKAIETDLVLDREIRPDFTVRSARELKEIIK